ncbi:MAG: zinc ribbon domain-containing protein [Christensenellales bacterium]|jgi:predicted  nucleic acid-binding Zn-ribbon protein
MNEQLKTLIAYQELSEKVKEQEDVIRKSPVRKKLLHARNYLVTAQKNLEKMETEAEGLTEIMESITSRYEAVSKQLEEESVHYEAADKESDLADVQDMRREVTTFINDFSRMEKEVQNLVKRLAVIDQEMKKMAANVPKAKSDYITLKAEYDKMLADLEASTKPIKEQMKALSGKINKPLLQKLKSAIHANAANPIVPIEEGRCTGCNMNMPSLTVKRISEEGLIMECENCGRILYAE